MTSKLWQTFGAIRSLFEVHSPDLPGDGYVRDEAIRSLSIDAGTTMFGLSTSAAEVTLHGSHELDYSSDKPIRIDLSSYGRHLLAGPLGVSPDSIRYRFKGRIAGQTVTDNGLKHLTTKLTAQDWAAFISQIDHGGYAFPDDPSVWRLYENTFNRLNVPVTPPMEAWGSVWHWVKWPDNHTGSLLIPTSDVIGKYCADLGNLITISRDGTPRAWSHDHIIALAEQWRSVNPHPLQRSQVLKPVDWTRDVSIPIQLRWRQWQEIGSDQTIVVTFPPPNEIQHRVETIDMLHIWDIHNVAGETGLADIFRARSNRETRTRLAVEKVTIDVLALYRRNVGTDRALIGQILTMSHGDPVALGYDWPEPVNGVYFVQRIAHKITPDAWTVDLDLVHTLHVTGHPSPTDLAGETWATAYPSATVWDTPSTTWEDSP